jgi:hypothetical protein
LDACYRRAELGFEIKRGELLTEEFNSFLLHPFAK